jgi:hypothetical protein
MKKTLYIFMLSMVALIIIFSACKKSSSSPTPNPVMGTWQATSAHIVTADSSTSPATLTTTDTTYTAGTSLVFIFGTDSIAYLADYTITPPTITGSDSFYVAGSNIRFVNGVDSTDFLAPFTITGTTMSLTIPESEPGESKTSTYQLAKQ